EARGPNELRLALSIVVIEVHGLGRVDLVLTDVLARHELENVQPTRDLGADDVAVVPVGRPRPATRHSGGVDGTAIEERDLSRTPWVGPVEHRDATLVPRLHHHVPTRNWNQRAVMGDTVLLR